MKCKTKSIMVSLKSHLLQNTNHGTSNGKRVCHSSFSLPPLCPNVLSSKIEHTNWVNWIGKDDCCGNPSTFHPVENGWALHNDLYATEWYTGGQMPHSLCDLLLGNINSFETEQLGVQTPGEREPYYEEADEWREWIMIDCMCISKSDAVLFRLYVYMFSANNIRSFRPNIILSFMQKIMWYSWKRYCETGVSC